MFKTTLNEFKNRDRYIKDDFRFKDACRFGKQNPRKFIKLWAEKEMYNLNRYMYMSDSRLYLCSRNNNMCYDDNISVLSQTNCKGGIMEGVVWVESAAIELFGPTPFSH